MNYTIENPRGSYKQFADESDPYPLKGVTYPVDYGSIPGYIGEDGDQLDVFVGTGTICGYLKVWRTDVPEETKMIYHVTDEEYQAIRDAFAHVLRMDGQLSPAEFTVFIEQFKN